MSGRYYEVGEPLGRGGFGTVYRARYQGEGGFWKNVALKVLNANTANHPEVAQRLRDEARMLGQIRHRAIVQVDRLVCLNGRWTVAMEFVEGVDLAWALRAGTLPAATAVEIVGEVAAALDAAWRAIGASGQQLKLQHRDIKPSNIQVTAQGEIKVLDFGIARSEFDDREAHTRSILFGSPPYIAPERLSMEDCETSDIYSLGVMLHELCTGERIGASSADSRRHWNRIAESGTGMRRRGLPEPLCALVAEMLQHDPDKRPTAAGVVDRCEILLAQIGGLRLRAWARDNVPALLDARPPLPPDELSGAVLVDEGGTDPRGAQILQAMVNEVDDLQDRLDAREDNSKNHWNIVLVAVMTALLVLVPGTGVLLALRATLPQVADDAVSNGAASDEVAPAQNPTPAPSVAETPAVTPAPDPAPAPGPGPETAGHDPVGGTKQVPTPTTANQTPKVPKPSAHTTKGTDTSTIVPGSVAAQPESPPERVLVTVNGVLPGATISNVLYGTLPLPAGVFPGKYTVTWICQGKVNPSIVTVPAAPNATLTCKASNCLCSIK